MRNKITPLVVASMAAFIVLSACGQKEPEAVGGMYDPDDSDALAAEEAELTDVPPMVRASKSYRCKDNSVVYVTFYTNDTQVGVADSNSAPPTILSNEAAAAPAAGDAPSETEGDDGEAPAADGPIRFSGDGQTVVGTGDSIQYAKSGSGLQTCNG